MAGEYGRRSKSRCMTPCLLNSIIYVSSHESVEQLPKEKPSQDCEGFALKEIRSRKRGEHKTSPSRCSCSKYRRFEHSERTWSCAVSQSESSGYSLMHRNSSTPSRPWIVALVLDAVGLHIPVYFGCREQKNLVGRRRGGTAPVTANVIGCLCDGFHL